VASVIPQEVTFITDGAGRPTSQGCVFCLSAAARLEPGLSFEDCCTKVNNPPAEEKDFPSDFYKARKALEAEEAKGNILPVWVPGAECDLQMSYGHTVYSKYAGFTEAEFFQIFSKTPQQLGASPWYSEFQGPSKSIPLFLVSLVNLPESIRSTCRKVKLYHSAQTALSDQWLSFSVESQHYT